MRRSKRDCVQPEVPRPPIARPLMTTPELATPCAAVEAPCSAPASLSEPPVAVEAPPAPPLASGKKTSAWKERGSKNLTYDERRSMLDFLLERRVDGTSKLARHAVTDAATEFRVDRRTVSRLWKRAVQSFENGDEVCDVASRKVGHRGRRKRDWSAELKRVKEIPLSQRGSIRALAMAVGIPKTTLYELLKEDGSPCINSIKPSLTDKNKLDRLRYCADKVRLNGIFDDMHNVVHVNVKRFALSRDKKTKIMFMAAVARPQWDLHKNECFDGKIGTWPFVREVTQVQEADVPPSPERTFVALEAVTKDDVQRMITELVIPAIRVKMPVHLMHDPIYIQQDSVKIRCAGDASFAEEGRKHGWNIQMQALPPYSPDFVVMDSALFKPMLDALKASPPPAPVSSMSGFAELISGVEQGFASLTKDEINDAFLTLQKAMECTMRVQGANTYELGPTSREQLQMEGSLPVSILCEPDALLACKAALDDATREGLEAL